MKTQVSSLNLRVNGRSLVEIMIALTIGMVILIAVSSLFIANRQTFRANDDKTRLDEEGRLALHLMATQVRMAGYGTLVSSDEAIVLTEGRKPMAVTSATSTDTANGVSDAENAIRGCRNGFVDPKARDFACAGGTGPDAFSVSRDVDQVSTLIPNGGLMATDCLGTNVLPETPIPSRNPEATSTGPFFRIVNRFFIRNNPETGNPELYCQGNGNTLPGAASFATVAQPIAENVEMMRVLYGISTDNLRERPQVEQFVTANNLDSVLTAAGVGPRERWSRVVSVRICIVVRSANNNVVTAPQSYRDCEDQPVVATDRRLRGVFSTTIAIRSRSVGAT